MRSTLIIAKFIVFVLLIVGVATDVDARGKKRKHTSDFTKSGKYASLVVNAKSGDVIYSRNANKTRYPASLTKLMTLYLAFQALEDGRLYYYQKIPVSKKASLQPRTKLWLKKGQKITVRDAMLALIIRSANDSAVVLAEAIDGTEAKFAKRMTKTARQLGMKNTTFKNASGLPNRYQKTTAYDMAKLAIALRRDFPKYYPLFSKTSFKYRGKIITSHNRVLTRYKWADGLKTGFTNASGYNLVTSTNHPSGKLVGVVMGGPSSAVRDNHMIQILDFGLKKVTTAVAEQKKRAKRSNPTIFRFVDRDKKPSKKEIVLMSDSEKKHHEKRNRIGGVFEAVGISKLSKDSPQVFNITNAFVYADKVTEDSEEMEFAESPKPKEEPKKTLKKKPAVKKKNTKLPVKKAQKKKVVKKKVAKKKAAPKKKKKVVAKKRKIPVKKKTVKKPTSKKSKVVKKTKSSKKKT